MRGTASMELLHLPLILFRSSSHSDLWLVNIINVRPTPWFAMYLQLLEGLANRFLGEFCAIEAISISLFPE